MTAPLMGPILVADELDAVRSYMTSAAFAAFLDQCRHHIAKHIDELTNPPASPDRLATLVHAMIGTAGVIGAGQVVQIARRLETAAKASAATGELTAQLIDAWAEAGRELQRRRDFQAVA
ncbi:MAG: Hpt domain-containing protein [Pseudomonadota bacterium]|nr:Hpt domain-containing protein [Pseudomonadota bacterium]